MNSKTLKYTELAFFYGGVSLNIWILCHFTFISANDGFSHMYYSRILNYLFTNNAFLSQYFVINHLPLPNLTDHYLLALFDFLFSSAVSQKLMLVIFHAGFPICFRLIIKKYNPGGIALSSFIIPFTHCWHFYYGEYNFCLSLTFLFLAAYYYLNNFSDTSRLYSPLKYFLFFLLVLLNYFTNGISFLLLGFICGMAELFWLIPAIKLKAISKSCIFKRAALFCLFWIPGLVMLHIVNVAIPGLYSSNLLHRVPYDLPFSELIKWFYNLQCLAIYGDGEEIYRHLIFLCLVIAFGIAIYMRIKNKSGRKFLFTDTFLLLFIIITIAYFIIPLNASVGLISYRLFYYLIIFLLVWIAIQINIPKIALPLAAIVLTLHALFFFNVHFSLLSNYNDDALDVQKASAFIKPNSVVMPYMLTSKPMEGSISNVLGIDKPLLILEWYEPDYGWFAVNRTTEKVPKINMHLFANNKLAWADDNTHKVNAFVDYIFFYGDYYGTLAKGKSALKDFQTGYTLIYSSGDKKIFILQVNH